MLAGSEQEFKPPNLCQEKVIIDLELKKRILDFALGNGRRPRC